MFRGYLIPFHFRREFRGSGVEFFGAGGLYEVHGILVVGIRFAFLPVRAPCSFREDWFSDHANGYLHDYPAGR